MVLKEHADKKDITEDELCAEIYTRLTTGPFSKRTIITLISQL